MASHDLDDKRARVAGGSAGDGVDAFADTVETSNGADSDVGRRHVIIDGSNKSHNVEMSVLLGFFGGQLLGLDEFLQQTGPFGTEDISTGQGTISTADNKGVD